MTHLKFLGSCKEIGRSGFMLDDGDESLLIDYGVKFANPPKFPDHVPIDGLQGVAVTHAHLDHSGGVSKILSQSDDISLFCTKPTRDLTTLLSQDMYNISRGRLPFARKDIARIKRQCHPIGYEYTLPIGHRFEMTLFNAGHIPGSGMVSVGYNGKRILFTGDFNITESRLMAGAHVDVPKHDYVITESTYATRVNPRREEIEEALIDSVIKTLERDGTVLIPAFAVGRSQEIMCILEEYGLTQKYPIYIDGMARKVNEILNRHSEYLGSPQLFKRALQRIRVIRSNNDRRRASNENAVIISPAGMLKGGSSMTYFRKLYDNPNNAIILVSFQIPGTPGAELLENKEVTIRDKVYKVDAELKYHHLSSHSDSYGLMNMLESIPGDPEFHIVHGEPESTEVLAEQLETRGKTAHVPLMNDIIEI